MVVMLFCAACGVVLFRIVPSFCRPRSPQEVAGGTYCGVVWCGVIYFVVLRLFGLLQIAWQYYNIPNNSGSPLIANIKDPKVHYLHMNTPKAADFGYPKAQSLQPNEQSQEASPTLERTQVVSI